MRGKIVLTIYYTCFILAIKGLLKDSEGESYKLKETENFIKDKD